MILNVFTSLLSANILENKLPESDQSYNLEFR